MGDVEIKTLNGYPLADVKARGDVAALKTEAEGLRSDVAALDDKKVDKDGAVTSVNGKTGTVQLTAEDVGALPEGTEIPAPTVSATVDEVIDALLKADAIPAVAVGGALLAIDGNIVTV